MRGFFEVTRAATVSAVTFFTSTLVRITESGWKETPEGLKASYGNCEGWTSMLCALKVWVEQGVNLREFFY